MLILAFDASTSVTTVALARTEGDARQVLAEVSVSARGASGALLPAVNAALDLAGEELACVERVLAGVGPGTFTGIRIAAATARALALATGAALSKNSTLAALAAPALSGGTPDVLAILDARRGQVFVQRFSEAGSTPSEISCERPEALSAEGAPLLLGDGAVRYREALSYLGRIPADDSPLHRVTAAGHVLSADLAPVGAEALVPNYVREPDAEVRRDLNPWSRP
jgi:tRNA threonylcarbamoyladenosine biosynthesis protein TsaB